MSLTRVLARKRRYEHDKANNNCIQCRNKKAEKGKVRCKRCLKYGRRMWNKMRKHEKTN